ncbi:MAG TPA: LuxR C-terminal-related transcriptional regulator [Ideonella sp.]|jgi:DNA-binding CsgD family transcriptional regulator|nr:LuxR C-terminal-related transcriptional regulator [Ideonella sp.]
MNVELAALECELAYRGPERRGATNAGLVRLMAAVLDEIDYGLMLLSGDGLVVHANHAALREMGSTHPLELRSRRLRARDAQEQPALAAALEGARRRGARSLLNFGAEAARVGLSIVPLPLSLSSREVEGNAVLLTLQRTQLVEKLSVGAFARERGLSQREQEVLGALCEGLRPNQIAERMGVAVATVRSHVHNLKEKTHSRSMVELVKQVALLPPLVTALKTSAPRN